MVILSGCYSENKREIFKDSGQDSLFYSILTLSKETISNEVSNLIYSYHHWTRQIFPKRINSKP